MNVMMMGTRSAGKPAPAGRHSMCRTTSMTEFAPPEVLADVAEEDTADGEETELQMPEEEAEEIVYGWISGAPAKRADWLATYRARAAPTLVGHRWNSADFSAIETTTFLRACGLCNCRLGPGRDTFMYRGDMAFCSLECRQQHISQEKWKEKTAMATPKSMTPVMADTVAPASATSSDMSTLAAA